MTSYSLLSVGLGKNCFISRIIGPVARPNDIVAMLAKLTLMWVVPGAALFLGMHAAAAEQANGTIDFLQALPIRTSLPAAIKLLVAALLIAALVTAVVALAALASFMQKGTIAQPESMANLLRQWGRTSKSACCFWASRSHSEAPRQPSLACGRTPRDPRTAY